MSPFFPLHYYCSILPSILTALETVPFSVPLFPFPSFFDIFIMKVSSFICTYRFLLAFSSPYFFFLFLHYCLYVFLPLSCYPPLFLTPRPFPSSSFSSSLQIAIANFLFLMFYFLLPMTSFFTVPCVQHNRHILWSSEGEVPDLGGSEHDKQGYGFFACSCCICLCLCVCV